MTGRRTVHRGALLGAVAGVLVLALAGCQTGRADDGGDAGAGSGGDVSDGGADEGGDLPEITGDGSTLVLQVHSAGGYVPWGYDFASVPSLSVYADGTAIVPGPTTLEYPGKVLPNLQMVHLPDGALEALVAAAADAGLLAPAPDYGMPNVTDLPTTTVTIAVGGETFEHAAYALGVGTDGNAPGGEGMVGGGDPGLTDGQSAARVTLAQFVQQVNEMVGATGAEESYVISALGVLAMPVDPAAQTGADGIDPQVVPWPVAGVALAGAGGCALVEGADAETLLAALADANQLTQFDQDGVVYQAWFRPLLPHEATCADLVG